VKLQRCAGLRDAGRVSGDLASMVASTGEGLEELIKQMVEPAYVVHI
jgi:hypothetical protein